MNILIDLQGSQTESKFRGIGRYSLSITKGLLRNNKYHNFYIFLNGNFEDTLEDIKKSLYGLLPEKKYYSLSASGSSYVPAIREMNGGRKLRQLFARK
jgi:hypothetical protein